MTLAEAIQQLIVFGERDPYEIAQKLIGRHQDEEWFRSEIVAYADDLVSGLAARQLGALRRNAEHGVRRDDASSQQTLLRRAAWIPEIGYKALRDCTAEDLRARAALYAKLARENWAKAAYYNSLADRVEYEQVETLGQVQGPLPEMPHGGFDDGDSQMELAA